MTLDEFCSKLETRLAACTAAGEKIEMAATALSQAYNVQLNEVGIFRMDEDALRFVWPVKFQSAGVIPLNSRTSLVARTAREGAPTIDNTFAATPHAFFFEQYRRDQDSGGGSPIQKIMSAPLQHAGELKGVVQIARKGETPEDAGKDFAKGELQALVKLADIIAAHLLTIKELA